jgi:hypothetical protein
MTSPVPWEEFDRDPRSPDLAPLRASDRDRELALRILSEAYADGRLARDEFDERVDAVNAVRTLGELPQQLADLLPQVAVRPAAGLDRHRQRAVEKYEAARRQALWTFLSVSTICWVIWMITEWDHLGNAFQWPWFVMLGTGLNAGRILFQRQDIINEEIRRRERRESKRLAEREKRERRQLPPTTSTDEDGAPTT